MKKSLLNAVGGLLLITVALATGTVVWSQVLQSGDKAPPPEGTIAIRAGRMFDAKAGTMLTNQVIVVTGGKIADVGPSVAIPPGASVIDLSNATVTPGMIDTHVHITPDEEQSLSYETLVALEQARNDMLGGFTTLVDMSGRHTYAPIDVRNAINRGLHKGPRIQSAGVEITPRDRSMAPTPSEINGEGYEHELFVAGPWMARFMVRKLKHYGADWVKIYATQDFEGDEYQHFKPTGRMVNSPSLTLEELQAMVDEAHRRGMRLACHAFGGQGLADCIAAGVDKIEHGNEMTDELAKTMAQKNISWTFTLQNMLGRDEDDFPRSGGKISRWTLTQSTYKMALTHKVNIAFGSDTNPPEHGHQAMQLAHYVKFGATPAQALNTAFMNAANALNYGWASQVGSIEKGKYADIIAVAGDPLKDITEMERVKFVMKNGEVMKNELGRPAGATSTAAAR